MDLVNILMLLINVGRFFMDLLNFIDKQRDKKIYPDLPNQDRLLNK